MKLHTTTFHPAVPRPQRHLIAPFDILRGGMPYLHLEHSLPPGESSYV